MSLTSLSFSSITLRNEVKYFADVFYTEKFKDNDDPNSPNFYVMNDNCDYSILAINYLEELKGIEKIIRVFKTAERYLFT